MSVPCNAIEVKIVLGVNDIMACKGAAAFLIAVVNRKPFINSFDKSGIKPNSIKGKIAFRNVQFSYPTRPDVPILKNISFTVNQGETVALVGHSGCGRSTTVSLVQRFYNPSSGMLNSGNVFLWSEIVHRQQHFQEIRY